MSIPAPLLLGAPFCAFAGFVLWRVRKLAPPRLTPRAALALEWAVAVSAVLVVQLLVLFGNSRLLGGGARDPGGSLAWGALLAAPGAGVAAWATGEWIAGPSRFARSALLFATASPVMALAVLGLLGAVARLNPAFSSVLWALVPPLSGVAVYRAARK